MFFRVFQDFFQNAIFLVLKSTVLGGLSLSGFLTKTEPSPVSELQRFCKVFQNVSVFF